MRIDCSIEIDRPIDEVYAFVSAPEYDTQWCPKVRSVEADGEGRWSVVHKPIPLRPARTLRHTLVSASPPTELRWHEDDGHDVLDVTYELESLDPTRTRLTQRDVVAAGAPRILHGLIRRGIAHDVGNQLKRLKRLLEAR